MSGMNPFQSCSLEFRKAKGKHTWLLFLALLGINMAYLFLSMRQTDTKMLSSAWEQTLFSIPPINTLFLSVVMAILSSGAYDIEHKGNTWNLLQTMQSRQSIFLGKTLYGLIWLILFGALQGISMIAVSKYLRFIGVLPISKIIIAVFSEIISGMVVYQIGCLLALLFPSQFAALSINLGGTLAGFFLMFVTDRPATPWSLLVALRVVDMKYQESDASVSYEWFAAPASSWIIAFLFLATALILGMCIYTHIEEGTFSFFHDSQVRSVGTRTSLPAELIKLKRSPVWIAFFIIPIISAVIGTFNFMANQGVLSFTWESLWTQHSLFLGTFFLPPLIGILCSLLWRMEHTGTNWNLTLSLESPWKLVKDKLFVASGMSVLCILWIGILYIIVEVESLPQGNTGNNPRGGIRTVSTSAEIGSPDIFLAIFGALENEIVPMREAAETHIVRSNRSALGDLRLGPADKVSVPAVELGKIQGIVDRVVIESLLDRCQGAGTCG